jgi:hypothetical protein
VTSARRRVAGQQDPAGRAGQRDEGQPDPGDRDAVGYQALLDLVHQWAEVDLHGAVVHLDRAAAVPGEDLVDGGVGGPVRAVPELREKGAGDDVQRLIVDEAGQGAGDRTRLLGQQRVQPGPIRRRDILEEGLEVQAAHHGIGDPVRDRSLDVRVRRQRRDGADVPVGVSDEAGGPGCDNAERREDPGQEDQKRGEQRLQAMPSAGGRHGRRQLGTASAARAGALRLQLGDSPTKSRHL